MLKKVVNERLKQISDRIGKEVILMEDETIEKEYYWVFFYNTRRYVETGNFSYCLAGNAPIIIDKINGEIHKTGTGHEIAFYLKEFEKTKLPTILKK